MEAAADGQVFQVHSEGYGASGFRLTVRKFRGTDQWLFGGTLWFRPRGDGHWHVGIELDLNPLRFFSHRGVQPAEDPTIEAAERDLRVNRRTRHEASRLTLDGNDNFILPVRVQHALRADWVAVTTRYLELVALLVERELLRCRDTGLDLQVLWSNWTVRHAESTWEFEEHDARQVAREVGERLTEMRENTARTTHANSTSYAVPLQSNVSLGLYAKSATRLRIELRHTGKIRARYQRLARTSVLPNRTLSDVGDFLRFVNERASVRLNTLLASLASIPATHPRSGPYAMVGFINAVTSRCAEHGLPLAWLLLPLLETGRVAEAATRPVRAACEQLVLDGVLHRVRTVQRERWRTYGVAPAYEGLLASLRVAVTGPLA